MVASPPRLPCARTLAAGLKARSGVLVRAELLRARCRRDPGWARGSHGPWWVDPWAPGFWRDFLFDMLKLLAATAVVAMAVALSFSQRLGLEGEMLYAIARAFLQFSVIGFVLQFIFTQKSSLWILLAYLFMVTVAGYTAAQRAKQVPRGKYIAMYGFKGGPAES